jgi:general secretion pathway protein G
MKKHNGFTLLELLIITAVVVILIYIALPALRGMQQETRLSLAQADLRTLKIALDSYYKTGRQFPPENNYQTALQNVTPKILENTLVDPFSPNGKSLYRYKPSKEKDANYFVVFSVGPNTSPEIISINNSTGTLEGEIIDDIYETNGVKL